MVAWAFYVGSMVYSSCGDRLSYLSQPTDSKYFRDSGHQSLAIGFHRSPTRASTFI